MTPFSLSDMKTFNGFLLSAPNMHMSHRSMVPLDLSWYAFQVLSSKSALPSGCSHIAMPPTFWNSSIFDVKGATILVIHHSLSFISDVHFSPSFFHMFCNLENEVHGSDIQTILTDP